MADPIKLAAALDYYDRIAEQRAKMFAPEAGDENYAPEAAPLLPGNMTPYDALRMGRFGVPLTRETVGAGPFSAMGVFSPEVKDPSASPENEWRSKSAGLRLGGEDFSVGGQVAGNALSPRDQMSKTIQGGIGPVSGMFTPIPTPIGKGSVRGLGMDLGPLNVQAIRTAMPMQKPTTSYEGSLNLGNLSLQGSIEPRGGATIGGSYPIGDGKLSFAGSRSPKYEGDRSYNAMLRYNLPF